MHVGFRLGARGANCPGKDRHDGFGVAGRSLTGRQLFPSPSHNGRRGCAPADLWAGSVGQDVLHIFNARRFPLAEVAVAHTVLTEKETWRRFAIFVLALLLLPLISAENELLLIYLPLYPFLSSDRPSRLDAAFLPRGSRGPISPIRERV